MREARIGGIVGMRLNLNFKTNISGKNQRSIRDVIYRHACVLKGITLNHSERRDHGNKLGEFAYFGQGCAFYFTGVISPDYLGGLSN